MVYLIGDIHGDFFTLKSLIKDIPAEATIVQVGDFGIWPNLAGRWKKAAIDRDIYFIDGNHDYIPWLDAELSTPSEIWPHAIYVPRGYTGSFDTNDGKVGGRSGGISKVQRFLFLGGSKSVDRAFRRRDSTEHGWFEGEQLTVEQAERAIASGPVDLMITHTPPDWFTQKHLGRGGLIAFGINPASWCDESARLVEHVWNQLGKPKLYCGHVHRSIIDENVQSLDINEVLKLEE